MYSHISGKLRLDILRENNISIPAFQCVAKGVDEPEPEIKKVIREVIETFSALCAFRNRISCAQGGDRLRRKGTYSHALFL